MSERFPLLRWVQLVRSKNAGPFTMTIDIVFTNLDAYRRAVRHPSFTEDELRMRLGIDGDFEIFWYEPGCAVKITYPRQFPAGSIGDWDVYGGQFYSPTLAIDLAETPVS